MAGLTSVILGCDGPRLTPEERRFFAEVQPWGFILFARNVQTPDQVKRLTDGLRDAVGRDAPILIDQEGGRVQRMGPPHWRQWLPPLDQMAIAGCNAARTMELRYRIIASELRNVGIDVNCGPTCDIAEDGTHPILKNRCYGTMPGPVTDAARAVIKGLRAGGVSPVMKHMPGHGRALVDSHLGLPVVTESAEALRAWDFAPFTALSDLPMAMTAHIVFTAFDPDQPATTSVIMQRVIREEIGFTGLLMTDDISMEALAGGLADRTAAAHAAGCDLVLHCSGRMAEMQEVVGASHTLSGVALLRAEAALAARPNPVPIDIAEAEAELEALLKHGADDRRVSL
ncbi:glycoside hydrolase family 3 protein [Pseudoruegeria sp. HB172150]|uniref:glycoside hydrolase family 3 protein n=1 Tax=Pseudoruegeria sp. HB172150 TaxID=2721164 RepID=UPI001555D941|nr:glycoside hydrolase family 3 protein [Pseudoruegeria sp. HB172150]